MSHNHKNALFESVLFVYLQNIHAEFVTCDMALVIFYMHCTTPSTDPRHALLTLTDRRRKVNRDPTCVYSDVHVTISSVTLGTK